MSDLLSITVKIADKSFPLKIRRDEEEKIRKAAKMINDTLTKYKRKYGEKDVMDYLSMVALQYATKALELDDSADSEEFVEDIKHISQNLDEYINSI